jgi:ectoine hydroxylase
MRLTQQQVDDFNREGWLFLPELYSPEEVNLLAHEAEGIYDTDRPEVWREKSGAPRTAFAAHLYNEAFALLGAHPRMIDPVEQNLRREGIYASVQDQRQIGIHR